MRSAIETDDSQSKVQPEAEQGAEPPAQSQPEPNAEVVPLRERALGWARRATEGDRPWFALSWLGLLILAYLIVRHGDDAGVSYDENSQRHYGDLILAWFRSSFTDQSAMTFRDLYLYGGLFDAPAQWLVQFSPYGVYETRHFLTAFVALLGVVATWRIGAAIAGPRGGFLSALILTLTPCWIGHGLFNPKDIPFATAAAFASLSSLRLAMGPAPLRLRDICWAGVTVGIALAVRPGGNFVVGYPYLAAGFRLCLEVLRRAKLRAPLGIGRLTVSLVSCVLLVLVIAWPIMLLTWPWAQLEPFKRPLAAMAAARRFNWTGTVLFEGNLIDAGNLPLRYLPVWFKVTLPEIYLLAALAIAVLLVGLAIRRPKLVGEHVLGWTMLSTFVGLPFAAVLITRPVLYDAQRHVLFLLPPLAALAGCVLSEVFGAEWLPRAVRGAFAGVFVGLAILVSVDIVQLHPFEYTYFNRLSGGLVKQYRRFETDYWSIGYREGLEYVVKQLPQLDPSRRTRVVGCDLAGNERLEYYLAQWPGASDHVRVTRNYEQADVLIATKRWNCHRRPGKTIAAITRQDAPLVWIRKIQH
jgi:hypothetical protein